VRILIVDDSSVMRKLIARSIRQAGFRDAEILEASDGAEGLVSAREHCPDLVMADWNMPNMSGLEMLKALREEGDSVRLGFVTSESSVAISYEATQAGASFFLNKPIDADLLCRALEGSQR